jgi:large subunit ribosomal protein L29
MSDMSGFREMSVDELLNKEKELRHELFNLRFQHTTRQLENNMRIKDVRRDIARIKTSIKERGSR